MEPLVSVIMPVYNREQYIEEAIRSVQAQSYDRFEILLVEDGSTDSTPDICRRLAQEDNRIRLLQGEHQGVSAARNLALDNAVGQYVLFVDSDDVIYPQLMQLLVESMEETGAAMGGTQCAAVEASRWDSVKSRFLEPGRENTAVCRENLTAINELFTTITPLSMLGGVMLRRDLIGQTRFREDLYIGEDFYFLYENLIKGSRVICLQKKWYMNRTHSTNISLDHSFGGFQTRFARRKLTWESEERFGRFQNANSQKKACLFIYLQCVRHCGVNSADGKKMRKLMGENRKQLMSGLPIKMKLLLLLLLYLPFTVCWIKK